MNKITKEPAYDPEWKLLIIEAINSGISVQEIKCFLSKEKKK